MCITSPASTISSMKVCARPISPAMARVPREQAGTPDDHGVHFIGLVNVVDLKAGGLGRLGPEQLAWLADDIKDKSNSTPMLCSRTSRSGRSMPIGGWGTDDGLRALDMLKRFGSVTVLNGLSDCAEGRRQYDLPHCTLHLLPAAGPPPCSALPASQCGWATSLSP